MFRPASIVALAVAATVLVVTPVHAAEKALPAAPQLGASAHILIDYHSGKILSEANADEHMAPASITKVMTSYVVSRELAKGTFDMNTLVPVSEKAWRMKGSRMFIEVNTEVSVADLLRGLVIQSGNDASVALAEFIAGSEEAFAQYMNITADELGLSNTNFTNSTGWPHEEHYTSARDIATLARALIHDYPEHYAMYSEKQYTYNDIVQYNRNKLLWRDKTVDGIKTGHTSDAGYCLVSSALRDGMRLIAVVLGAKSEDTRAVDSQKLLGYGFRFFETHRLYAAGETLNEPRVWQGASETLPVGLVEDLYVTVPRGEYKKLDAALKIDSPISAPVAHNQSLGSVRVNLYDQVIAESTLVALQEVPEGSLWQQARDAVLQFFE